MSKPTCEALAPTNLTPTTFTVGVRVTDDGGLPCYVSRKIRPLFVVYPPDGYVSTDAQTGEEFWTDHEARWNHSRLVVKYWISNDDGHSWSNELKFFLPTDRHPADGALWLVMSSTGVCSQGYYLFRCTTDTPCFMTAHWSHLAPDYKQIPHTKRGVTMWHDVSIAFHTSRTTEQMETYDSIEHTFKIPFLQKGNLYYWYLTATTEGKESPSVSPLFSARCYAPLPSTIYYMQTRGKFCEGYGIDFATQWGKHDADNWWNSAFLQAYYMMSTGSSYSYCAFLRNYFVFDTRALPPGSQILHAWIHAKCADKSMTPNEGIVYLQACNPPAPHDPLQASDFYHGNFGAIVGMIPTSEITEGEWFDMDILPGKLGCITPGGWTNIGFRQGADVHATNLCPLPGDNAQHNILIYPTFTVKPELHVILA